MKQEELIGVITENGDVELVDGRIFSIPQRGTDSDGYPEVLIDAMLVGGKGFMQRQSIKPYIGMKCKFILNEGTTRGFNFTIIILEDEKNKQDGDNLSKNSIDFNLNKPLNCNGCKWEKSNDRMKLCPICNSNYDMYEKK